MYSYHTLTHTIYHNTLLSCFQPATLASILTPYQENNNHSSSQPMKPIFSSLTPGFLQFTEILCTSGFFTKLKFTKVNLSFRKHSTYTESKHLMLLTPALAV